MKNKIITILVDILCIQQRISFRCEMKSITADKFFPYINFNGFKMCTLRKTDQLLIIF